MSDVKYTCPICKDMGVIWYKNEDGYDYVKKCKCAQVKESKERLEMSGLANEFKGKTFENYYTFENQVLEKAKEKSLAYAKQMKEAKGHHASLLLCGQVGAGKTHLGTACSV